MGQKNYEMLNKVPQHMFWNSVWYSDASYKNYLYLDYFLKFFLKSVFSSKNSSFFFKTLNTKHFSYLTTLDTSLSVSKFFNTRTFNPYFSRFWVLSYKNWLFFSFFFFYPVSKTQNNFLYSQSFEDDIYFFKFLPSYNKTHNFFF
jgi:hypothetical protein